MPDRPASDRILTIRENLIEAKIQLERLELAKAKEDPTAKLFAGLFTEIPIEERRKELLGDPWMIITAILAYLDEKAS